MIKHLLLCIYLGQIAALFFPWIRIFIDHASAIDILELKKSFPIVWIHISFIALGLLNFFLKNFKLEILLFIYSLLIVLSFMSALIFIGIKAGVGIVLYGLWITICLIFAASLIYLFKFFNRVKTL